MKNPTQILKNRYIRKGQLEKSNVLEPVVEKSKDSITKKYNFDGKVVIVTGASSGIGKACAFEFAKKGAKVVLAARREFELKKLVDQIAILGGEASYLKTDVKLINDCKLLIDYTIQKYGRIDVLVNNAGISMRASFEELDLSVIKNLMDTNFYGTVYCTKFALPYLLERKGTVIGVSSISGLVPLPGRTGYCASKHAMDGFLNTLRIENMRKGLNVLVVHPGFTISNIRNTALNKYGNPQKETPRNEAEMMSAEKVAQIILKSTLKRDRSRVLTMQGKLVVWLYKNFPGITDRLILNEMAKESHAPV